MKQARRNFLKKAGVSTALSCAGLTGLYLTATEGRYQLMLGMNDVCAPDDARAAGEGDVTNNEVARLESLPDRQFYETGLGRGRRQFLLFGDTDHSDPRHTAYFYSKEHIDRLANLGVKHIFIETPKEYQIYYDDLVEGRRSPLNFGAVWGDGGMWGVDNFAIMEARGHSILYAAEKGIKVHCSDILNTDMVLDSDFKRLSGFISDVNAAFKRVCPAGDGEGAGRATNSFLNAYEARSPWRAKRALAAGERVIAARHNDVRRADYIRSVAGNDRSVVYYGAGHFGDHENGFKDVFGKENCLHVNLFPDIRKAAAEDILSADFTYILDRGTVYRTGDIAFDELDAPPAENGHIASLQYYSRRDLFRRFTS